MDLIADAVKKKTPLTREARRLFHGRGHCYPGYEDLVIDWFNPVVLIILYRRREESWLRELASLLKTMVPDIECILIQERYLNNSPSRLLHGVLPEKVYAEESGLRYILRLGSAQNIGFFPDMKQGRTQVREHARGKKILNLFSYTCGFSVAAVAGGAEQVVNLDMNRGALSQGQGNHQCNEQDLRRVSFLPLELFRSFSRLKKIAPFDMIVCDPPAAQGKNFQASRDWPKIMRKIPELLCPDGEFLACISAPDLSVGHLKGLMEDLCPEFELLQQFGAGPDFPEKDADKGLRIMHFQRCR